MNDLHILIGKKLKKDPKLEIFDMNFNDKKIWIKKARKTGSNVFHKFVYSLNKNPLLAPVEDKDAIEALHHETTKLERLYQLEIPVPKLIGIQDTYFMIEDRGPTVAHLFYHENVEDTLVLCQKIVTQLANLHNKGEYHGASQIKNFTYENNKIFFIDFEESFDNTIALEDLQFRDLFLLFFSLQKMHVDVDFVLLIDRYKQLTHKTDIDKRFQILTEKVSLLMKIMHNKYIWKILDKDSKSVYAMMQQFKNISSY